MTFPAFVDEVDIVVDIEIFLAEPFQSQGHLFTDIKIPGKESLFVQLLEVADP